MNFWFSSASSLQDLIGSVCHNMVLGVFNVGKLYSVPPYIGKFCNIGIPSGMSCILAVCNASHTGYLAC